MDETEDEAQWREWDELYAGITAIMASVGTEDAFGDGDYLIVDDNYGWRRHKIEVHRLKVLSPAVVAELRHLLQDMPDWEIVVALDIPGTEQTWP